MNVSFNQVSQWAHVGWGYLLTTLPVMLLHWHLYWVAPAIVLGAAIKEYSDAHGLETPDVAGNSWEDFSFWCVGVAIGIAALMR
jgi:hypothetical protein